MDATTWMDIAMWTEQHREYHGWGLENAIIHCEDVLAASLLDLLMGGSSMWSLNHCCPVEYSVWGSRLRCSWDEVLLKCNTLPNLPCLSHTSADTTVQMCTATSWEPVANMKGSATEFQGIHVRSPPRDCTWTCSSALVCSPKCEYLHL